MREKIRKLLPKFIISLGILGLNLTIAISFFSYNNSKAFLEELYAEQVIDSANVIASMLDIEDVRDILGENGDQTEAFQRVTALLNKLKKESEITFLSLVIPDAEGVTFYIDAMVPEMGDDPANQIPYGSRILYTDAASNEADLANYQLIWEQYTRNKGISQPVITDNSYGYNYTGVAPILDENGNAIAEIQYIIDMLVVRSFLNRVLLTMLGIAFAIVLFSMVLYVLFVRNTIILPIAKLADFTQHITKSGEFKNQRIDIQTGDEIEALGSSFNYMMEKLDDYMENFAKVTAEKERIGTELHVATQIQADMLPSIFPPFPERKDFDIYATMNPAKEVGGDFYDFFLIDPDHLALVMADVSGKGVPAALFMVIAKTLIKNHAMMGGGSPAQILEKVNNQLCEGNEAGLFVTVWLAILDLKTGKGIAANAGHEYPALCRAGGQFELIKTRHSPALACMEDMHFREREFQLYPGDSLYVYTDGVTEATNAQNQLFGTSRMLSALNRDPQATPEVLLNTVKADIDAFVGDAPQFDDITMLCLHYSGEERPDMQALEIEAIDENLAAVNAFIDGLLEENDCPMKAMMQVDLAVEEIFINIARYAYAPGTGNVRIQAAVNPNPRAITITFQDSGVPYNPLEKDDPDTSLTAEERGIGGLGIFLVKKNMSTLSYEYKDGCNLLTATKEF